MAAGALTIKIVGDTRQFRDSMSGLTGKLDRVGSKMRAVGRNMSRAITLPIALAGGAAVKAASDLEQSAGAVESVFGSAAGKIQAFGDTAAESFGLSRREVNETAAVLGAQLQSMGFSASEAADEVITLEERAADMAATFGGTTREALDAISSLMRGERDPIEKYGVSLKQVDINARIAAMGLDTSTREMEKQAEATAAMAILMEQTNDVQGQFAREADTVAGSTQRARAKAENLAAELGDNLMPIANKLLGGLNKLAERFSGLTEEQQTTVIVVGAVVAALGPLISLVGTMATAVRGLSVAMAFLAANPIVLVIAAVAALVAGLVIAYQRSETFRRIVNTAFDAVKDAALNLAQIAIRAFGLLVDRWLWAAETIVGGAADAFAWVPGLGDKLKGAEEAIGRFRDGVNAKLAKIEREIEVQLRGDASHLFGVLRSARAEMGRLGGVTVAVAGGRTGPLRARAHGGPVTSGEPFLVGEEGPEVFVPNHNGRIVPGHASGLAMPEPQLASSGGEVTRLLRRLVEAVERGHAIEVDGHHLADVVGMLMADQIQLRVPQ